MPLFLCQLQREASWSSNSYSWRSIKHPLILPGRAVSNSGVARTFARTAPAGLRPPGSVPRGPETLACSAQILLRSAHCCRDSGQSSRIETVASCRGLCAFCLPDDSAPASKFGRAYVTGRRVDGAVHCWCCLESGRGCGSRSGAALGGCVAWWCWL